MFKRASILVVSLNLGEKNGTSEMQVSHCLEVDALLGGRSLDASNLSIFAIAGLVRVQINARHVPCVPVDGARDLRPDLNLRPDLRPTHHRIRLIKYISIFHRYYLFHDSFPCFSDFFSTVVITRGTKNGNPIADVTHCR